MAPGPQRYADRLTSAANSHTIPARLMDARDAVLLPFALTPGFESAHLQFILARHPALDDFLRSPDSSAPFEGALPAGVLPSASDALACDMIPEPVRKRLAASLTGFNTDKAAAGLAQKQIGFIGCYSDAYPQPLRETPTPPVALFTMGDESLLNATCVAIVGTRKATSYGKRCANDLAGRLADFGVCIVSGMALGIDGEAHRGALESGGKTIAVLGCGVDVIYPPDHHDLYESIRASGLIVSEFPPGTTPEKFNFPQRNHTIAGLSKATVVVEAPLRSGALITAESALEYNREVLAVPGPITAPSSLGCHFLIKQGAFLCDGVDDVLSRLGLTRGESETEASVGETAMLPLDDLPDEEKRVLVEVSHVGTHINDIARKLDLGISDVAGMMTMLEVRGLVAPKGGGYYVRL